MGSRKQNDKWSQESLQRAMESVEGGASIRSSATANGIPRKTLADYIKRGIGKEKLRTGPTTIFSAMEEGDLVSRIKRLQKVGFPLTRDDIRRTAYELAETKGIHGIFGESSVASKRAGKDWFAAFMRRHEDLSTRKTETLSYGRGAGLNRVLISEFYTLLEKTISENSISPQNIFNMDETGVQLSTRSEQVIAEKGSKRLPQLSSGEKGETVSVVACCSATGVFLPPVVIFKGIRRREELGDGLPVGAEFHMTESGYAQSHTFRFFINFLLKHKPPGKALLIMDGHRSHIDAEAFETADKEGIVILLLPAHTSHELQPLDKSVFKSLKTAFYSQSRLWHTQHPGRSLNKLAFHSVFTPAWNKAATRENAVSGFTATGIFPLNPYTIPDSAFGPSEASERPNCVITVPIDDAAGVSTNETLQLSVEIIDSRPTGNVENNGDHDCEIASPIPFECDPSTAHDILISHATPVAGRDRVHDISSTPLSASSSQGNQSFSSILTTPKITRKPVNAKRSINNKGVVLTAEHVRKQLPKKLKGNKNTSKEMANSVIVPLGKICKSSSKDKGKTIIKTSEKTSKKAAESAESSSTKTLSVGDWVLVKYTIKKQDKCYVGFITGHGETAAWAVHFLKLKSRTTSSFIDSFSASQDNDDVDDADIVSRLPIPRVHRGLYKFEFDFSDFMVE